MTRPRSSGSRRARFIQRPPCAWPATQKTSQKSNFLRRPRRLSACAAEELEGSRDSSKGRSFVDGSASQKLLHHVRDLEALVPLTTFAALGATGACSSASSSGPGAGGCASSGGAPPSAGASGIGQSHRGVVSADGAQTGSSSSVPAIGGASFGGAPPRKVRGKRGPGSTTATMTLAT